MNEWSIVARIPSNKRNNLCALLLLILNKVSNFKLRPFSYEIQKHKYGFGARAQISSREAAAQSALISSALKIQVTARNKHE